jgi:hypothetical protein
MTGEHKHFHQSAIAKAHERAGTIKADQAAAQQGAKEHLESQAVAVTAPTENGAQS